MVLTWPSVPLCQALAVREVSQDPGPAPCRAFLAEEHPRLVQSTDSALHPGKMSLVADRPTPGPATRFLTGNGGHRLMRAAGGV